MLEVAEHYQHFGGVSPINAQVRDLIETLRPELQRRGVDLPVYWGNRNWHPLLTDVVPQMKADGVHRALAIVLSAYSSYSGCRQYRENIADAVRCCGDAALVPRIDKMRVWYNHPEFIAANADRLRAAIERLPAGKRHEFEVAFTAHSIPESMAVVCDYQQQLTETCRLIAEVLNLPRERWALAFQSRSGRPTDPWLEPDINDHLRARQTSGATAVVVAPIGFLSDHMEVLFDLDHEAAETARELGLSFERAGTVGTHPRFVAMLGELIVERLERATATEDLPPERRAVGQYGPNHDVCPAGCCPPPRRPNVPPGADNAAQRPSA